MILSDPSKVAELRVRLSDISWWMRMTCQPIAQRANREDGCTGRFWEGRYKAQLLLDEAAILACAMYVDLNPIRAEIAQSLEDSEFTGAKARIDDLRYSRKELGDNEPSVLKTTKHQSLEATWQDAHRWERRSHQRDQSGWLCPMEIQEQTDRVGPASSDCGRRVSLKGFLPISIIRYLELLDWTGRQLSKGKRGSIPATVSPILNRLGIRPNRWMDLARQFGQLFRCAAGRSISLESEALHHNKRWLHAPGKECFT